MQRMRTITKATGQSFWLRAEGVYSRRGCFEPLWRCNQRVTNILKGPCVKTGGTAGEEKRRGGKKLISSYFLPASLIAVQRQNDALAPVHLGPQGLTAKPGMLSDSMHMFIYFSDSMHMFIYFFSPLDLASAVSVSRQVQPRCQ